QGGLLRRSPLPHGSCRWAKEGGHKARIIPPLTPAPIVLIEGGSCRNARRKTPKATASGPRANARTTPFACVGRLVASSEKLFINTLPKDVPVSGLGRRPLSPSLGRCYQPMRRGRAPASVPAPQQARPS